MTGLRSVLGNKWFKFALASLIYILIFVVWTGNPWWLLGVPVIYDIYISKYIHRLVWRHHKALKERNKGYKTAMEWVEAIVFAVVVVTLLRIFWFAMYVIPTPSMEKTLLVGDYLCVSKLAYGPAMPNTPISFPFVHNTMPFFSTKKSYSECLSRPYHRLKGLGQVERGDVVVFNFPAGDTVILERQSEVYYDILRAYEAAYGEAQGRKRLYSDYTVVARPVDKRENYVKRCVGLPGDTIRVDASKLTVNGLPLKDIPEMAYEYYVRTTGAPINPETLGEMGLASRDVGYNTLTKTYEMPLTAANLQKVSAMRNVISVRQRIDSIPDSRTFPQAQENYPWSGDNFGPLWVPRKGATVALTPVTLPLYRSVIANYEGHTVEEKGSVVYVDGEPVDSYTFEMDYYFMMGDNRHNSLDSRYWGFVPEDHIVGKASFVWLSLDEEKSFPANIRWSRMFRSIK